MSREHYHLAVAVMNGRPQRLATVSRAGGPVFRDQVNADSSRARNAYISRAAAKFEVDREELAWLDDALVSAADEADVDADLAAGDADQEVRKNQSSSLIELCAGVELFRDPDGKGYARFKLKPLL